MMEMGLHQKCCKQPGVEDSQLHQELIVQVDQRQINILIIDLVGVMISDDNDGKGTTTFR